VKGVDGVSEKGQTSEGETLPQELQSTPAAVPTVAELAARVGNLLPQLASKLLHFVKDFPVPDVTVAQAFLMHHLWHHGPCTASTLGELLGVTSGPVTSLTKRLIGRGLVTRRPDAHDGRVVWFSLTADGVELAHRLSQHSEGQWGVVIAKLGRHKALATLAIMEDTIRVLNELESAPPNHTSESVRQKQ